MRRDDPFRIATEHVAWWIGQGLGLAELHDALEDRGGAPFATWNDAIWTLARVYSDLAEKQHPGRGLRPVSEAVERVMSRHYPQAPEPFRQREPPRHARYPRRRVG